jgi:hypothetical protein
MNYESVEATLSNLGASIARQVQRPQEDTANPTADTTEPRASDGRTEDSGNPETGMAAPGYNTSEVEAVRKLQAAARIAIAQRRKVSGAQSERDHELRLIRDVHKECMKAAENIPELQRTGDKTSRYRKIFLSLVPLLHLGLQRLHKEILTARNVASKLSAKAEGPELNEISERLTLLS